MGSMESPLCLPDDLRSSGLVVPVPEARADRVVALVELLLQEGVRWFTVASGSTLGNLLTDAFATRIHLGVHGLRVWDPDQQLPPSFALTTADPVVCAQLTAAGIAAVPGAMTPTEVHHAWSLGVAAVQVIATQGLGAQYPGLLREQVGDDVVLMARGVEDPAIARIWAQHDAVVVCGGEIVGDALSTGRLNTVRTRLRPVLQAVGG